MPKFIGIDIGSRFVKVVCLERLKKKIALSHAFVFPTPHSKGSAVQKIDSQEFLNQLTKSLPVSLLKSASIGVNIPSSFVTVIVVTLPRMSRAETTVAAIAEAKRKMVPTPGPSSIFEHISAGEVTLERVVQQEVLVVKTEKPYIDDTLATFASVDNMYPSLISPVCYTILNFLPPKAPELQHEAAFINIGYDSIDITIAKKGHLRFYRNIKFGLKDIIAHVAAPLGVPIDECEKVLMTKGVPAVDIDIKDKVRVAEEIMRQKYEAPQENSTEINPLELRMLWETEVDRIVNEIRRTQIYYQEQSKGGKVGKYLFFGGGARIPGLVPVLQSSLDSPCESMGAFSRIDQMPAEVSSAQDSDTLFTGAVSVALSLAAESKAATVVNFLPPALKRRKALIKHLLMAVGVCCIAAAFLFLAWLNVFISNAGIRANIERMNDEMKRREDVIARLDGLRAEKANIEQKSARVREVIDKKYDFVGLLTDVARLVPKGVVVQSMAIVPQEAKKGTSNKGLYRLTLLAEYRGDYDAAVKKADRLSRNFEQSDFFANVILSAPTLEKLAPTVSGTDTVIVTQELNRAFSIEADVVKPSAVVPAEGEKS